MLNRTSSRICGRWYLPVFLLRDGLLTLMYRASFMALHWDSHHTISSKDSVVGTLHHRAKTICSNRQLLQQEEEDLSEAQMNCKYPIWALNRVKMKMNKPAQKKKNNPNTTQQNTNLKPYITVPYYKGLSESVKKKCNNYGVQAYFRGGTTIKNLLMAPKDKDPMLKNSGVIYSYKCGRVKCDEEYIGGASRTHQKASSPYMTTLTPLVTA